MEISLEHFRELEAQGIAQKPSYGYAIRIPNEDWKKGDLAVVLEGEHAGSIGYISYMSTTRIVFPEDEKHTAYEIENECSLTFINKVGDPQVYGWKLQENCIIQKIEITVNGIKASNMDDINNIITNSCLDAISDLKLNSPYEMEINHNVEVLPMVSEMEYSEVEY